MDTEVTSKSDTDSLSVINILVSNSFHFRSNGHIQIHRDAAGWHKYR